jgi:hypothetical protein
MARTRPLVSVLAFAALASLLFVVAPPQQQAKAAATVLCAPNAIWSAQGSRSITNPNTGTSYILNSNGCAVFAQADVTYFVQFQGFAPGPPLGTSLLFTTGTWAGTTSFQVGQLPAATYVNHILMVETAGNAVTGGVKVGTTSGGADVVAAQTVGASSVNFVSDVNLLKRVFSATAVQPLFVTPATAGNNANVTVTVVWGYF